jgi:primase-polymerase (primpol)-like protein
MPPSLPSATDLPAALTDRNQWVCWTARKRDGKQTKVPVNPKTGRYASATDPDTWTDFDAARSYAVETKGAGVGFVFSDDDPFVGVDLDDCRDADTEAGELWVTSIINRLDSYTEVSPSGTGYHVIVRGSRPTGGNRTGNLELYESARFFTMTGEHVDDTPETVEPRTEMLAEIHAEQFGTNEAEQTDTDPSPSGLDDRELRERAANAANGEKFSRLFRGDTSGYESNSEADMALAAILAFWSGGDEAQIDRLFRDSGLYRQKWDDVHFADGSTYGEKTVERAVQGTDEFYEPHQPSKTGEQHRSPESRESEQVASRQVAATQVDESLSRRGEANLERMRALTEELEATAEENERLRAQLRREKQRRQKLEDRVEQLTADREQSSSSVLDWFRR